MKRPAGQSSVYGSAGSCFGELVGPLPRRFDISPILWKRPFPPGILLRIGLGMIPLTQGGERLLPVDPPAAINWGVSARAGA